MTDEPKRRAAELASKLSAMISGQDANALSPKVLREFSGSEIVHALAEMLGDIESGTPAPDPLATRGGDPTNLGTWPSDQPMLVVPRVGVGPILLGSPREALRHQLGTAGLTLNAVHGASDYFCNSTIQVDFGATERAEFIGVNFAPPFQVIYEGRSVFHTSARDLFELIADREASGHHKFNKREYLFPDQIIALWDARSDYARVDGGLSPAWAQVGVGDEAYLAGVLAIRASRRR